MTSRDFCYWLQGYFEVSGATAGLDAGKTEMVKRHLAMVFAHEIDPSFPAEQKGKLDEIHVGPASQSVTHLPANTTPIYRC